MGATSLGKIMFADRRSGQSSQSCIDSRFLLIRALGRALANDVFSIRSPSYFVGRGADPVLASPAVQALFVCVAVGDFKDVELSSIFGPCSAKLAAAVKSVCPRYHDVKSSPICRIA